MHTLFDNLQFRVLRDRLFATLTSAEPEVEGGFDVAEDDVPRGELGDWLHANARTGRTGLIFRGTWGRGTGELTGIALAAANDHATFVDRRARTWTPPTSRRWPPGWPTRRRQKVVHEVKGPLLAIWARGWELEGVVSDTALAAYLALPGQRSFDLGDLAVRYLKRELQGRRRARGAADARRARARARTTSPPRPRTPTSSRPSPSTTCPTPSSRCSASAAATRCSAASSCR